MGRPRRAAVLPVHWGKREQIGLDRQSVAVGDAGEARIREHWEIVRSVGPHAFAECSQKLRVGPAADTGFRIGCDIRTVERANGGSERSPSRQLFSPGNGMAREGTPLACTRYSPRVTASSSASAGIAPLSSMSVSAAAIGWR